mmetsp:Transcript_63763/g.197444  ORF Transcript_63763/g.197444 Transcript_63763/m.197444 type:complete len:201 (-) Transcript_63763:35-637(-)
MPGATQGLLHLGHAPGTGGNRTTARGGTRGGGGGSPVPQGGGPTESGRRFLPPRQRRRPDVGRRLVHRGGRTLLWDGRDRELLRGGSEGELLRLRRFLCAITSTCAASASPCARGACRAPGFGRCADLRPERGIPKPVDKTVQVRLAHAPQRDRGGRGGRGRGPRWRGTAAAAAAAAGLRRCLQRRCSQKLPLQVHDAVP